MMNQKPPQDQVKGQLTDVRVNGLVDVKIFQEVLKNQIYSYYPYETSFTLQPNGVPANGTTLGYTNIVPVQTINAQTIGLLTQFVVDAVPGTLALSLNSNSINMGQFGGTGQMLFLTNTNWTDSDVFPHGTTILVGYNRPLNLGFTNVTNYNNKVNLNWILGFMRLENVKKIMAEFGFNPADLG